MKKFLGLLAILLSTSTGAFAQETKDAETRALQIAMEILQESGATNSPVIVTRPGEWFYLDIGTRLRSDVAKGSLGYRVKCLPEPQPGDALSLDCSFSNTEVDGANTNTRTAQMKFVVAMGKSSSLYVGDSGGPVKMQVNVRAFWVPMPEKVAANRP